MRSQPCAGSSKAIPIIRWRNAIWELPDLATGAYPQARQYLEQVLAVAPGDYMAQFELGLASEHLGLYKDALEHLEAACKAAPEAAQCRRELATVKQNMSSPH